MLETCSGKKSLLLWNRIEKTGEKQSTPELDILARSFYLFFFNDLASHDFSDRKFISKWEKSCKSLHKYATSKLNPLFTNDTTIPKILNKLKGNVAEIFVEYLFRNNLFSNFGFTLSSSTYKTVDPDNEEYIDAEAIDLDGLTCGIQIKNWKDSIPDEVFIKAEAMDNRMRRRQCNPDNWDSQPRQYIISFSKEKQTNSQRNGIWENVVKFIGPNDIDQALNKFMLSNQINNFCKAICTEISNEQ